jgi:hypothetical protein
MKENFPQSGYMVGHSLGTAIPKTLQKLSFEHLGMLHLLTVAMARRRGEMTDGPHPLTRLD